MIRFELRLSIDAPSLDEATQVLRSLVGTVRSEPGCGATRLLRDLDDPGHVTFIEEWRSRADLQRHMGTAAFRKILAVMELASREPVVEIYEIASRRGFDLVEETLGDDRADAEAGVEFRNHVTTEAAADEQHGTRRPTTTPVRRKEQA